MLSLLFDVRFLSSYYFCFSFPLLVYAMPCHLSLINEGFIFRFIVILIIFVFSPPSRRRRNGWRRKGGQWGQILDSH